MSKCEYCGNKSVALYWSDGDGGCLQDGWYGNCETCGSIYYEEPTGRTTAIGRNHEVPN